MSDRIITISQSAQRDIAERFGRAPEDITVIAPAVDLSHFTPVSLPDDREPTILFVGTRDRRKNVGALLRAFAQLADAIPHRLIVAGAPAVLPDHAEAEAERLGLGRRVMFKPYVAQDDLPKLYAAAQLFVWPSVYEGWGFPPQEAMACGTPVIVSDGGALPEVIGDAGSIVPFTTTDLRERTHDVEFERRLAAEILGVLQDSRRRAVMRQRGLTRAQTFSWSRLAQQTMQVYENAAGE
jgi:glycosyltransferase involved in cell wall biosynthesis